MIGLTSDPTGARIYSAQPWADKVLVIDAGTLALKAVLHVGRKTYGDFPLGMVFVPARNRLYVANVNDGTVTEIDAATDTVLANIVVGSYPLAMAADAAGSRVYVANAESSTMSAIDTSAAKVIATVKVGRYPCAIAIDPAGKRVAVLDSLNGVSIVDAVANVVVAHLRVGDDPPAKELVRPRYDEAFDERSHGLAFDPAGKRLYVADWRGGTLAVIDPAMPRVVATIAVGSHPRGVAVGPAGARVYVANQGSGTVSVVDAVKASVIATVGVGGSPTEVVIDAAGRRVYVANGQRQRHPVIDRAHAAGKHPDEKTQDGDSLSVIDAATSTVVATVPLTRSPIEKLRDKKIEGIVIDPSGRRLYARNSLTGEIAVIDTASYRVAASVAGPPPPISEEEARSYLLRGLKETKSAAWLTLPRFGVDIVVDPISPDFYLLDLTWDNPSGGVKLADYLVNNVTGDIWEDFVCAHLRLPWLAKLQEESLRARSHLSRRAFAEEAQRVPCDLPDS